MLRWTIVFVCWLGLVGSNALADDQTDQSQTDAAYARLQAKQAAATQPATISVADLNGLRVELAQLKAENASLKTQVANLTAQMAARNTPAPVAVPAVAAGPSNDENVVLSRKEFASLPKDNGRPLEFNDLKVGDVGWIGNSVVEQIEDGKTAVVSILLDNDGYGHRHPGGILSGAEITHDLVIKGMTTDGHADGDGWRINQWFKVTGTLKLAGTTYLLAQPIVEGKQTTGAAPRQGGPVNAGAPVGGGAPANQPPQTIPIIAGVWRESPGVTVTITQNGATWEGHCSYTKDGFGQVKWDMSGTINADGSISGTLHHTQAPKDWAQLQNRTGRLAADGKTITGTAKWDGGGGTFTWTKVTD